MFKLTGRDRLRFIYPSVFMLLVCSPVSQAAYISFDDYGVDQIFSQENFGDTPIDIRLGDAVELVNPDFLNINTPQRMWNLFSSHIGPWNAVNAFFVDNLTYCSGYGYWAGCGLLSGNGFIVDSFYAGTFYGAELLAHELGHTLGLGHVDNNSFLMGPFLDRGAYLAPHEVTRIFSSSFVQRDQLGWYIDITPVLVVPHPTPVSEPVLVVPQSLPVSEPATAFMLLTGLLTACLRRRSSVRPRA